MKNKKILVIAAHPDDEVLGCGGTIARHTSAGDEVHVLILGEGIAARTPTASGEEFSKLSQATREANRILGVHSVSIEKFPDNRMDSVARLDVIKVVESYVQKFQPELIYTHHAGDVNIDHRRIHEAVVTACRPIPGQGVKTVLYFEVASSTEWQTPGSLPAFVPNWFVNISDSLDKKLAALRAYSGEMRPWPHARSLEAIEHLAKWRGASIGVEAAEAFVLGRNLAI
jgi:LmbE family N-acetylglucosaminyl deacetylase